MSKIILAQKELNHTHSLIKDIQKEVIDVLNSGASITIYYPTLVKGEALIVSESISSIDDSDLGEFIIDDAIPVEEDELIELINGRLNKNGCYI